MLLEDFNEKYDLDRAAIHVYIKQGVLPRSVLYSLPNSNLCIDENYFIRRKMFNDKVIQYCQDMYYLITHSGITTDARLAKLTRLSQPWLTYQLFRGHHGGILRTKMSKGMWRFWRFCRRLERVLAKRYNIRFDINKLLNEEAKLWQERKQEEQISQSHLMELSKLVSSTVESAVA